MSRRNTRASKRKAISPVVSDDEDTLPLPSEGNDATPPGPSKSNDPTPPGPSEGNDPTQPGPSKSNDPTQPGPSKRPRANDEFIWKNLASYDSFAKACRENLSESLDAKSFTLKLCFTLAKRVAELEASPRFKGGEVPNTRASGTENKTSLWKGPVVKEFTYLIKDKDGNFITRKEMEDKFDEFMEKSGDPKKPFKCKGAPGCKHPPGEVKGKNNTLYKHLRESFQTFHVCYYCDKENTNRQTFLDHIKKFHWREGKKPPEEKTNDATNQNNEQNNE